MPVRIIDDPAIINGLCSAHPKSDGQHDGMSKREYFTGVALIGLLHLGVNPNDGAGETVAKGAVYLADAVLRALAEVKP